MNRFLAQTLDAMRRLARAPLGRPARFAGAVVVVALCCAVRAQLPDKALPYLFFIPGLMFIGFWFGVWPSVVGCVLAVLAAQYFFIGPIGFEGEVGSWVNSLSFGVVTLGMAVVCALFKQNLNTLDRVNRGLEEEVERRTHERDGIWNVSPDLICALSERGELLAINPAWHLQTGWDEQALMAGAFSTFIAPAQLADALQSLSQRAIAELDTQGVRRNGQPLHLNWRIAQRQGRYFAVARDVTLIKERQEALEQMRSQLQQSQKMEAVGQLTGGLAHDFNNLLTVIGGSLDMLGQRVRQGQFDSLQRYVELAQNAASRAASLTHRLLAYSRRQTLASKVVDPALLIKDMQELISRTLTPRIELQLLSPAQAVLCFCDAHQLENAILNLCINARDAMPQGGKLRIEISQASISLEQATVSLSAGEYAVIQVTDTGVGMPASVCERAFDPFFTTKPLGAGTGLGLSMVYGFARQSSGEAHLHSVVGEGTTVELLLPVHPGSLPGPAVVPRGAAENVTAAARGSVLVVDDESAIRDLVGEALEALGYRVDKAGSAAEARQRLLELPDLALLVTDIGLPGGTSGDELALAALEARPALKVLFISGFSENAIPTAAFEEGQVRLLLKPFAMNELTAAVERLCRSRAWHDVPANDQSAPQEAATAL